MKQLKAQGKYPGDMSLFDSLYNESTVKLSGHPRKNRHINIYRNSDNHDTTPVYTPSQYYVFVNIKEDVVLDRGPETEIPECVMYVSNPYESVTKSLLTTCHNILEKQPITDLYLARVRCEDLTVKAPTMSSKAASLIIHQCALPVSYFRGIIRQLFECTHTLQRLDLRFMDLKPIEKDLGELLERLVSFHESGEAQISLWLGIGSDKRLRSNLSQEFVDKWRPRCKKIKSIDCRLIGDD